MELKGRLGAIAKKIPQCSTLADIGTDHAYIPLLAVQNSICMKAVAADVKIGPIEIAARNIKRLGYEKQIETRLGYGLEPLKENEADVIVIAGMGGILIQEIIAKSIVKAQTAKVLILQPMNMVETLRKWLNENGFEIIDETLADESKKIYNIISVKWTGETIELEDFYHYIGYNLVKRKDAVFKRYAMNKINLLNKKIVGMQKAIDQPEELKKLIEIKNRLEALLNELSFLTMASSKQQ